MENIKILVCCHKQDVFKKADIYMPIQVGKALSKYNLNIQGDDMGENISEKNANYSELTGMYWAWKNLRNIEIVGLCHYRRYFDIDENPNEIQKYLDLYDIILPQPMFLKTSVFSKLAITLTLEDVAILFEIIHRYFPAYEDDVISYMKGNRDIAYNMFICKNDIFDKFCKWQFEILEKCEQYMRLSEYSRLKRIYGYIGEVLLPIYCIHNNLKVKHLPLVDYDGHSIQKHNNKFSLLYPFTQIKKPLYLSCMIPTAVNVGLKNDGIELFV